MLHDSQSDSLIACAVPSCLFGKLKPLDHLGLVIVKLE